MANLEFFFDVSSPWTYLAFSQVEAVAERCGAEIIWKPILVGGVFNAVNESVYAQRANPVPAKATYHVKDLTDWAVYYGLTINWPSVFPVRAVDAMRGCVVAGSAGKLPEFAKACFEAYWERDQDIGQESVLRDLAGKVGLDPDAFWAQVTSAEVKAELIANTNEVIERGGFGSPTMFVGEDDMYFGNDRLELVEAALKRASKA